jgi:hypothetical protein
LSVLEYLASPAVVEPVRGSAQLKSWSESVVLPVE